MRLPHALPVLLALAATAAGCLSDSPSGPAPLAERVTAEPLSLPWDVEAQVDWWEDVATSYPKHDSNLPTNAMLRERLIADLEGDGFEVEVRSYTGSFQDVGFPDAGEATDYYAIIATKEGATMPDRRVGLVSHYDSESLTIHGAYDDLSGVAAEYSICKALLQVELDRTLACIFFDAEERGLVASQRYVEDVVLEGDEGYTYDLVLGYDMTGLNWPGYHWKMYAMTGPVDDVPALVPFARAVLHGALGYPESGVEVLDVHDRNSDERRFKEAGVPIIRFAGGRHAADYDQYHMPLDTVEHVYELAGGRENFEAGFRTIVDGSIAVALAFDRTTMAELHATPLE